MGEYIAFYITKPCEELSIKHFENINDYEEWKTLNPNYIIFGVYKRIV